MSIWHCHAINTASKEAGIIKKILSLGSLNIDYVYRVDSIVRPGETISCAGMAKFCGGKGLNQSIALARAGAHVCHAGKIGGDGDMLLEQLKKNGVDTSCIVVSQSPTGHAIIQVDQNGQNSIVILAGANGDISEDDIDKFLSGFHKGDLLLLQNEVSNIEYAVRSAHKRGLMIALNPSPINKKLAGSDVLQYVDWLIMNEIEGYEITKKKDSADICDVLLAKYPSCKIVLTLGEKGCVYRDKDASYSQGIYEVPVVDTTAAGDTFTGYFLACMLENAGIARALNMASKAASIAVSRQGASDSIPTRDEVEKYQKKDGLSR